MSSRFRLIHIRDPDDGLSKPMYVKSYRKMRAGKKLLLTKSELRKNAKHLDKIHGGWIGPAIAAATALPGIIGGFRGLFGRGMSNIEGGGAEMPTKGVIRDIILSSVGHIAKSNGNRKGGRIFLGQGLKAKKKRIEGEAFGSKSSISHLLNGTPDQQYETYSVK